MFLSLVQGLSIFACSCPGRERHREIVRPGYVYTLETTPGAVVSGHEVIRMLELLEYSFLRQVGSHVRMGRQRETGTGSVTAPPAERD